MINKSGWFGVLFLSIVPSLAFGYDSKVTFIKGEVRVSNAQSSVVKAALGITVHQGESVKTGTDCLARCSPTIHRGNSHEFRKYSAE